MITSKKVRGIALAIALLSLSVTVGQSALAAETEEQKAVTLFESGRKLAREGKCSEAIAPLLESIRYAEGVGPLLNLGNCYETLGKTASAYRYFLRAQEVAMAREDKQRKEEAGQRAKALEKELSTLTLHVPVAARSSTTDLRILVDGEGWRSDRWETPVPIDPGEHEIEIAMTSRPKERATVRVRGSADHVTFRVSAPSSPSASADPTTTGPAAPPSPSPSPSPKESEASSSSMSSQRIAGLVVGGFGIAGLGVGSIFGVMSLSTHSTLVGRCPAYPSCLESDRAELDRLNADAQREGTISTISFIAGGVLLATGAILFLTSSK